MTILVGFLIAFLGAALSFSNEKLSKRYMYKMPDEWKHNLLVSVNTIYYISEIIFAFGVFCLVVDNKLIEFKYASEETSYFKRFIDFFTVYQIGIFVVLKIINSHIMSSYRLLLSEIKSVNSHIEAGLPIDGFVNEFKAEMKNSYLHPNVRLLYKEIFLAVVYHQNNSDLKLKGAYSDTQYSDTLKKFNASLTSKELLIESRLIEKEREWEGSLILRELKNRDMKKRRLAREEELKKFEKLYLSEDE